MDNFHPENYFFLIVFLIVSALSWISGKFKESRENSQTPSEENDHTPNETLRRMLESFGIPLEVEPQRPPVSRSDRPPVLHTSDVKSAPALLSDAEAAALERIRSRQKQKNNEKIIRRSHVAKPNTSVKTLLSPKNIRSAVILKEILDEPKGLSGIDR